MSTLDHLTDGRIGWNIVTGYLASAAKGSGEDKLTGHDTRYDIADEYMDVVYKLWEGSWEDGALLRDRERGIFTDPGKVHRIVHRGENFTVDAIHLAEPSPQRTPVLYQAGSSPKGRDFAARHAECVFVSGPSQKVIAPRVADIRRLAAGYGRNPEEILIFALATVIVAPTEAEACAKHDDYLRYVDREGALALMSGWAGIDLSAYAYDQVVRYIENDAGRSAMENITRADPDRVWTVGQIADDVAIGGIGPLIVGSPAQVADTLENWIEATGVDGFNLAYALAPETMVDFVDLVVPELQRRGRYKSEYAPGTLREKLFRQGRARLSFPHPAASRTNLP
jgi:FMN-dependent oxidoreductase (nitrilotriacetate monooxygenase family)